MSRTTKSLIVIGTLILLIGAFCWHQGWFRFTSETPFIDDTRCVSNSLPSQHTQVEGTGVSLRLPPGCKWMPDKNRFEHPDSHLTISVDHAFDSLEVMVKQVQKTWKDPDYFLSLERDVEIGSVGGKLFEGKRKTSQGRWLTLLILVLGNDESGAHIAALALEDDTASVKLMRESLMTAKWSADGAGDLRSRLEYTVTPAEGLEFRTVQVNQGGTVFCESGKRKLKAGEATYGVIRSKMPSTNLDRRAFFERVLRDPATRFSKMEIERMEPIKVSALEGLESIGTFYDTKNELDLFRYSAMLFKTQSEIYIVEGSVERSRRSVFETRFRQMTQSFQLK